jgi:alanine racemase
MKRKNINNMDFFIELRKEFLLSNIKYIAQVSKCQLAPVVKANAYGHGMSEVITILKEERSIGRICIISYAEAWEARRSGWKKKIILLNPGHKIEYHKQFEYVVYSFELLEKLVIYAKEKAVSFNIHIKCNCGLNRLGFNVDEFDNVINFINQNDQCIKIVGVATHLPRINYVMNEEVASQLTLFNRFVERVKSECKVSRKLMIHPFGCRGFNLVQQYKIPCNMIRPGGLIYGLIKKEYREIIKKKYTDVEFKQVMTLKAGISQIRHVNKDDYAGYGNMFYFKEATRIIVANFGYGFGYNIQMLQSPYGGYINGHYLSFGGIIGMNNILLKIPDNMVEPITSDYIILTSHECDLLHVTELSIRYLEGREYIFSASLNSNIPKIIV